MEDNGIKTSFFQCECRSHEHTIQVSVCDDPDWPSLTVSVQLHQFRNFWKRVWLAIKYVFGFTPAYGHWDTTLVDPADYDRLSSLVDLAKENAMKAKYFKNCYDEDGNWVSEKKGEQVADEAYNSSK